MKTLLTHLLLLFGTFSLLATDGHKKEGLLYVGAISGLNMRTAPSIKADKIINIPFGKQVQVIEQLPEANPFTYKMLSDKKTNWLVEGHWVKVAFEQQMGYVFSGYLCRLPMISTTPSHHPYFQIEILKEYATNNWEGVKEESRTTSYSPAYNDHAIDDKEIFKSYKLIFKDGSYYEQISRNFHESSLLFIKDISLEEAFLFYNAMSGFEYKRKRNQQAHEQTIRLSIDNNQLSFMSDDGMSSITIKVLPTGVLIESESSGC